MRTIILVLFILPLFASGNFQNGSDFDDKLAFSCTEIEGETLPANFNESHPTLELTGYTFFVKNRTIEKIDNGTLKIPKVFTHLTFECNSTVPTRWHFSGRLRDAQVQDIYVRKYRQYQNKYGFRSTIQITFRNPEALENLTCQNECTEELKNLIGGCQKFFRTASLPDTYLNNTHQDPFFYMKFFNGNGVEDSRTPVYKLGYSPLCNMSLQVDLKEGKYKCLSKNGSIENEMPTVYLTCRNPDECHMFYQKENDSHCKNSQLFQTSCNDRLNGIACFKLQPVTSPIILACGEDNGFSVARSFFPLTLNVLTSSDSMEQNHDYTLEEFPEAGSNFSAHFSHKEVLKLTVKKIATLYTGDTVKFTCTGTKFLLTYGIRWYLVNSNDSVTNLGPGNETSASNSIDSNTLVSTFRVTFNSSNIKLVRCKASWWNSFQWATANYPVNVSDVVEPYFDFGPSCGDPSTSKCSCEEVDRRASFVCPRNGMPTSNITWKIDDVQVNSNAVSDSWYKVKENETHSELRLNGTNERYEKVLNVECTASNRASTDVVCHRFKISEGVVTTVLILGIAIGSIILLFTVLLFLSYCKIKSQKQKLQQLPDEEVEEFERGNPNGTEAFLLPYNMDLEIPPEDLIISDQSLGSGAFAQVFKGQVGFTTVAIKKLKKTADVVYMRALLSELKIMSYVGQHANLVNLVGSCTRNIRKRELSIILEYCERGDLLVLLRHGRKVFVNKFEPSGPSFLKTNALKIRDRCSTVVYQNASVKKLSTINLLRWAYEIASGMEFLSSKNVVHGDLAARNILITHDLRAKVSDFGLSKQLFEYSIYVQKLNTPLPLRWMAYESLKDLEFSVESDIWSFGILLWELFSLGEAPYPGMEWGFGAWKAILNGYRMEKPTYASDNVYQLMNKCWDILPSARPTFEQLKESTLDLWSSVREFL